MKEVTCHIIQQLKNGIEAKCPFDCSKTFTNINSFRCHVYRLHGTEQNSGLTIPCQSTFSIPSGHNFSYDHESIVENRNMNHFSQFFCQLKAKHKLTQTALKFIADELDEILKNY